MKGQWIGTYTGTNSGEAIVEFDELQDCFDGAAYVYDENKDLPGTFAPIKTKDKSNNFSLTLDLLPIDGMTGDPSTWTEIQRQYPGVTFPSRADTEWKFTGSTLEVKWTTNIGTSGTAIISKSNSDKPSEYTFLSISSWKEFKEYATQLEPYRFMFRGQESSLWRLRTHFHRTGRAHLLRLLTRDIPVLHKNLSNLTSHVFNLRDPIENGAFFALVQHHGYPTPLLDWTHSPFIAAYFAYKGLRKIERTAERRIRVFVFDRIQWCADLTQLQKLSPARPHFSILDALALNNPRMVPQQALSSVTNVDDIETYIRQRELENGRTYLQVIDLPSTDRMEVMQELSLMGITAGSLFPGLDGAREQLKERFFEL